MRKSKGIEERVLRQLAAIGSANNGKSVTAVDVDRANYCAEAITTHGRDFADLGTMARAVSDKVAHVIRFCEEAYAEDRDAQTVCLNVVAILESALAPLERHRSAQNQSAATTAPKSFPVHDVHAR